MKLQLDRSGASGTLVTTLAAGADASSAIRAAAVVFIAAATAAAAQITVPLPFTPVPFAMQDMVVLLGGAALGSRLGMAAQVLYVAAGIAGLPVFAASAVLPQGVLRLLGPTGGYLLSYPVAAYVTGRLAERGFDRRYSTSVLAMIAGLAVIFALGVSWLALFARPAGIGFAAALKAGLYPFLAGDVLKVFLGAAILPAVWKIIGRTR
jgi:biotin transport system substrate-specific component